MSEKTPVSNFLNGLSKKAREAEQKIGKSRAKRNWDSESSTNQPKSFSEFDINEPLEKMNKKLGSFSSTVSSKFSEAVTNLNNKVNDYNSQNSASASSDDETDEKDSKLNVNETNVSEEVNDSDIDPRWKKVTMPDGTIGYTASSKGGKLSDNQTTDDSEPVNPSNVYDIFGKKNASGTKYVNSDGNLKGHDHGSSDSSVSSTDFLSGIGEKWNKHVANDVNTEKMTHLMDSFHNGLNQLSEKYSNVLDNSDYGSKNVREWFGTGNKEDSEPTWISGKSIASGSELLSVLTDLRNDNKPGFGVVVDKDNENNALMMAIIAARSVQHDFLNLDLANSAVNDLADKKANRAFEKVQNFMSENTSGLVTVDAREISNDGARMVVEYLYHEAEKNGWLVLVLVSDVEQLVSDKETFANKFKNTTVVEY